MSIRGYGWSVPCFITCAFSVACGPADVRCDAWELADDRDEGSPSLVHAQDTGSLELSGSATQTRQDLTLRITGLSKIGFSRVGEFDSSVSVSFETRYLDSVPPGAEEPALAHTVIVEGGVRTRGRGTLSVGTQLEVPIFGCETQTDLGLDATCCPIGEEVCELELALFTSRDDQLFPATVTTYSAEAHVELISCDEESMLDVQLIKKEAN